MKILHNFFRQCAAQKYIWKKLAFLRNFKCLTFSGPGFASFCRNMFGGNAHYH